MAFLVKKTRILPSCISYNCFTALHCQGLHKWADQPTASTMLPKICHKSQTRATVNKLAISIFQAANYMTTKTYSTAQSPREKLWGLSMCPQKTLGDNWSMFYRPNALDVAKPTVSKQRKTWHQPWTKNLPLTEVGLTALAWPMNLNLTYQAMTLTLNPLWATVMTYSQAKIQAQRPVGYEDS